MNKPKNQPVRGVAPSSVDGPMVKLLQVIEEVVARRSGGELVSDEAVVAAHPELMPDLAGQLRSLHLVEQARAAVGTADREAVVVVGEGTHADRRPAASFPLNISAGFPGYEIEREIGRGAMGVVYKGRQKSTGRDVAIKVMIEGPFAGPHDRIRFEREARILGQLKHPYIVTVYDTGVAEGNYYLVMDYVAGEPLDAYVASGAYNVKQKMGVFAQICDAVGAAHLRGVIHRDLKPGNIRVDVEGEPHVLDFGLAKTAADVSDVALSAHSMTMTGQFVGSLPWASPEQAEGSSDKVDVRTDVYSLGVIFYQMLTGRFPYGVVGNIRDVVDNILNASPEKPSTILRRLDDDVETIVLKCLAKDRERRYQSAIELARDIRHYLSGEPIEAKRDSGWYVLRKTLWRHRLAVGIAAASVAVLAGFATTMSVLFTRAEREADRAKRTLAFLEDTLFEASSQQLGGGATLVEVLDETARRVDDALVGFPEVAAAVHYTLGNAYNTLWRDDDAVRHLRTGLSLYRSTHGSDAPETLRCMVLLGMVLGELRDPQAVEIQREALSLRRARYGEQHHLVADSTNELAFALWRSSQPPRYAEAEEHYERALALYRQVLGESHADIARCLTAYASMRYAQGRVEDSEHLFGESFTMARSLLGEEHQFVSECAMGYASALRDLGRFEEAESLLQSLLPRVGKKFGPSSRVRLLQMLAALHVAKGDLAAAERSMIEAIRLACDHLAEDFPSEATRLQRLVTRFDDHRQLTPKDFADAFTIIADIARAPVNGVSDMVLASDLLDQRGDREGAELLLRRAIQVVGSGGPGLRRVVAEPSIRLARLLTSDGRFEEAEQILLEVYPSLSMWSGDGTPRVRKAAQALVELYEAKGKPADAEPYRRAAGRSVESP